MANMKVDADSCPPGLVVKVHDEYVGVVESATDVLAHLLLKNGYGTHVFIDSLTVVPEEQVPEWARKVQSEVRANVEQK